MSTFPKPDTNRLIETYRSYSHAIAAEVLRKLPPQIDKSDVIGAAELGLVEAANSFDPSRGVLFKTFAYYRIRGAIYDALRKMGWLQKDRDRAQEAAQVRFEATANEYMKDYTGASGEAAGAAGGLLDELKQLTASIATSFVLSLDSIAQEIPESKAMSPEQAYARNETHVRVRAALERLPQKNRQVLEEYYFNDATLEEIGKKLGLSKSWLCRLHAKSLDLLRDALEEVGVTKATVG